MRTPSFADADAQALFEVVEAHSRQVSIHLSRRSTTKAGLRLLLTWLERAAGSTWQERWECAAEEDPSLDWRRATGARLATELYGVGLALRALMCHRTIRPSYERLYEFRRLTEDLHKTTDRDDFDRVVQAAAKLGISGPQTACILSLLAKVLVRNGKTLDEVTTDDLMGYAASTRARGRVTAGLYSAHELLRTLGVVDDSPLPRGAARSVGRQTVEEMVDRRGVACSEMRALFIRYLREREPGLDYSSLVHLENHLVNLFWRDLECHHPGIDSLHLPTDVATEWKARMWVLPNGERRTNITSLFTAVRAFYLDIAQWAIEEPGIWAPYASPCPVSDADLKGARKEAHRREARIKPARAR